VNVGPAEPRVLHVGADDVRRQPGGLGRYVEEIVSADPTATALVVGPRRPEGQVVGVSDTDDPLPVRVLAIAAAVRRSRAEVIDIHFALYGLLPALWARRRRLTLVAHHHGPWADENRASGADDRFGRMVRDRLGWMVRDRIEGAVLRRADTVVTLSEAFGRAVTERHGLFPARVRVIAPGVSCPDGPDRGAARREIGLSEADSLVVAVRRLVPRTGLDVLIRAWPAVFEGTGGRGRLVIVGDGPERARLGALASQVRGGDTIQLTGEVSDDRRDLLFAAADVAVVPSTSLEGFGLVVLEAGCHGTPSVVTDVGGLADAAAVIGDDLVVGPGDAGALATRINDGLSGARPFPPRPVVAERARRRSWAAVVDDHAEAWAGHHTPRVVVVMHTARPSGAELAVARLLEARPDFDAHVVSLEPGPVVDRLTAAGVTTSVVSMPPAVTNASRSELTTLSSLRLGTHGARGCGELVRVLRRLRPDAILATSLKSGLLCCALRPTLPGRLVWSLTDDLSGGDYPELAKTLARGATRLADATVSNSAFTRSSWQLPAERSNPVIHPGHSRSRPVVAEATGPFTVVMVGRIAPWKGQDLLLDAFAKAFGDDDGHARLRIAGDVMFGEHDYLSALRRRSAAPDLAGRIEFLGHVEDIDAVFDGAHVVVHASRTPEPFGQVIVEAMAAGRAVVATAAGGAPEIVSDGVDGLLVPTDDVNAMATALRRLGCDARLRGDLAAAGARRARDLSIDETARAMSALLAAVVRDSSR
jgi:glycosyltransferase involved in cell wall biosynthesis